MEQATNKFLKEIAGAIRSRKRTEDAYKVTRVFLMVTIAVCGFLTASISSAETRQFWNFSPQALFPIGLISTVCAILNQALSPSEKAIFHQSIKKALQSIQNLVEFGGLDLKAASRLMTLSLTEPDKALEEIHKLNQS